MRLDIGAKLVAAKKGIADAKRMSFSFEVEIIWQPRDVVAVFLHPTSEMWRFAGSLFVPKITRDKFLSNSKPGVGGENHVGKFRLRRNQIDLARHVGQRRMQIPPLLLRECGFRAARATHPGIDLVLDAVMVRRTKEQLANHFDSYFLRSLAAA